MTFRAGDGSSYIEDTFISGNQPTAINSAAAQLEVAGSADPNGARQALIRFENLFGSGAHQIPINATIKSATLTLWATGGTADLATIAIHRNLSTWNVNTANWDFFYNGLQPDDAELQATPLAVRPMTKNGYQLAGQAIVNSLNAWRIGEYNGGFTLLATQPNQSWSFAGSESMALEQRPLLTIEYTTPAIQNPSYAELSGQPPSPLKLAWFDWADDLRQRRLDRVPNQRTSTFYFAQNGDDINGHGTMTSPWKSLAKAQEIAAEKPSDIRFRFRRGDSWREPTVLHTTSGGVTVDDYGDTNLAKPMFTRFSLLATTSWEQVKDNVYLNTEDIVSVGWVREAADGFNRIYYRAGSRIELETRPYSWWFDATASDSASNGQPTLYVNANGDPANLTGGLEYCPGDGQGWVAFGDNIRFQNLRLEGQGMAADGFGYGLQVLHRDQNWEFVGQGLEIYYTGYHSFGHIAQYQGTTSVVTLVDVKAGYCTNRFGNGAPGSGDVTVFVSYADWGGNEYYQYDCKVVSGALPSSDWAAVPGLRQGQGLYTHVGQGGQMVLLLAWKTSIGFSLNPVEVLNNMDGGAAANDLNSSRTYVVEDAPGSIPSWWQKSGSVTINNILDWQNPPPPYDPLQTTMYYGPFAIGGWVINSTVKVDARNQFNGFYEFVLAGQDATKYINCHIDISKSPSPTYFRNPYLNPVSSANGLIITNSIISIESPVETGLNAVNDSAHLVSNGYYLQNLSANPSLQYTGDAGQVNLTKRFAAGTVPSPSNAMYNAGVVTGLEYDQLRQPRGSRRTLGPLAGAPLPAPEVVKAHWGLLSLELGENSVVPSHLADRVSLTWSSNVDLFQSSVRLWGQFGEIATNSMTYDAATATATWYLATPLAVGRYVLELDSQPIRAFGVLPGDITGDGAVSGADFNLFRTSFGGTGPIGDFNGDGSTDGTDFNLFRQMFGASI